MTLLSEASFLVTPNGYKASKLYAAIPTNGNGDMTFTRATTATRVDENDLVSSVASNVPRIDYTGGGCPSILLEPQRTNIVLRSEDFYNGSFAKGLSSIGPNTTTAPDGTLTADTWTGNGASGSHFLAQIVSATSGVAYTQSVFAKKGTNDFIQMPGTAAIYDANSWANFDLENGVVGTIGSSATATITDFGNGWYRCTMTATATTTTSGSGFALRLITSADSIRLETNSLATSVYLWGAQVEAGAYPTSYIPTVASTVTRNADAISKTGISDLIGQTEGVLFVESAALFNDLTTRAISISDGTGNNRLIIYYNSPSNQIFVWGVANGVLFPSGISYNVTDETEFAKIALRYEENNLSLWVNGYKRGTDLTSQALPINFSRFGFDSGTGITNLFAKVKSAQLYKTYLSDAEMASLTTL
jgi:hypothetical protein